jgi:diguanylate cyclase (GGDEF)-like protein/PAS domain S-box-containing protein
VQPSNSYLRHWFRALAQPVTYLGAVMLVCIYCTLVYLLITDRQVAEYDAGRRGDNLARVVDQSFAHIFKSVDATLLFLRKSYEQNPSTFDLSTWVADPSIRNELTFDFGILDAGGRVIASSFSKKGLGVDRSNREYFRAHANSTADELLISRPVVLEVNGKWAIILSRRITAPDGAFAGVILAMLDPSVLVKYVGAIDLGPDGSIALVGLDSYLRTRSVNGSVDWESIGKKVRLIPETLGRALRANTGHYWSVPGVFNNVRRLISYRVLKSFPLISLVSISEAEVYRRANENARIYWGIGLVLTVAIVIAIGFGALREQKLLAATSEMKRAQGAIEESRNNLERAEKMARLGHYRFENGMTAVIWSEGLYRIVGQSPDSFTPTFSSVAGLVHPDDRPALEQYRDAVLAGRDLPAMTLRVRKSDGQFIHVENWAGPLRASDGSVIGMFGTLQDITDRKLAEDKSSYLANHDVLTGIGNRAVLHKKLEEALARVRQYQETFSVLLLDLDGFKHVNDTLGHAAGDELLKELADRLSSSLRETGVLTRLGGDEFAIIQSGEANQREAAIALAIRVLEIAARPFDIEGQEVMIGTSIGIALAPEHAASSGELLQKADVALYRAKAEGRNNFRFFDAEMGKRAIERHRLLNDLRTALTRKEFELHYQPIFDAKTRRPCGVEALIRWRHPSEGLIPPDRFIPLAEETGLMEPLGEWILEKVCADAAAWPEHIKVAVNLSAVQFRSGKLFDVILCALVESGLPPERLELEITESVLMQNTESNSVVLQQLKNIGVSIVLDDFGTGYSSLSYLTTFPFDKIKVDKSFTKGLTNNAGCAASVASVLTLARALDMVVTAEGIETNQQFQLLRVAGIHQMQGYLFARPGPVAELDFSALEQKGRAVAAA